ncbi:cobalamin biosynthesis protein CbiB [Clostridium tepidiprofundi DSM 19306]|uniref:Cobalamin biosynthesis protein CobD n=1 Tax=Clostridium tepidiprofundi DSM 19306 TaxID=1121338 RepID=A0A151B6W0_9CLOT|nr:adenosylcobinamide-phosphate synthase CbiB [Clostridium tepidiprofundi]KYH35520.1 cobalamin biosynthesis protein CbiB [Clostridium tepidiprofundi DSM 19306]
MFYVLDIIVAVIIDWIVGDPYGLPHPVIYIGKLIKLLERNGRKVCKTDKTLKMFGGLIVLIVMSVSFVIPFSILFITKSMPIVHHVINILILWTTLACKCLKDEAKKVFNSLNKGDIEDARIKLSYIVGRETSNLNETEIIRADIETVAENASDGVIAPLIFAIIGGAPLAMMYKGINTMDSMLGYLTKEYKYIGFFPAKVDDIFNFIPARLTGVLMCLCAPLIGGNIFNSIKIMLRDRKNHKSPNCAYPEGAAAGAMGIQLGGTNTYFGEVIYKPTIGDKINELKKEHINYCIRLMYASESLLLIIYCGYKFIDSIKFPLL